MVGIGYDIHRLIEGRKLYLGGIHIDYPRGLQGHSDGDVLIHAICDALLGAANLGDIGLHFPPTDTHYKNIASIKLLKAVDKFLQRAGFMVKFIDAIIITEAPKLQSYIPEIKKTIAQAINIPAGAVSIKAKTNEGLDAVGRGEAIAAWAVCQIGKVYAAPEG